jgi:aryl-alcohol dehydrogenase-like predicted oxidoreductase
MEYTRLGATGLKVSRLCLGTMMFGRWGNSDADDCTRIVQRALDEGINFIDTANRYNWGESETIVGRAVRGRRNDVVIATKVFMPGPGGGLDRGTSRRHIMLQVEESLRRLGTDWIDLYQLHRHDKDTPIEETLAALTDLVRQGKVRYLGVSTGHAHDALDLQWTGWRMVQSLWVSDRKGYERFISTQPPYSIFSRDVEREIFPVCERFGFGAIVWSPLEGGWLAGRYRFGQPAPADSRATNETEFRDVRPRQLQPRQRARPTAARDRRGTDRSGCGAECLAGRVRHRMGAAAPSRQRGNCRSSAEPPSRREPGSAVRCHSAGAPGEDRRAGGTRQPVIGLHHRGR